MLGGEGMSSECGHIPVLAQGDVEQKQRPSPHDGGEGGPHPGAKLAEVTVVHHGHQHRRAREHGGLQEKALLAVCPPPRCPHPVCKNTRALSDINHLC